MPTPMDPQGSARVHTLELEQFVGPDDVVEQLGVSRATAYRMLAEAAGRVSGARGILRVHPRVWRAWLERRMQLGADESKTEREAERRQALEHKQQRGLLDAQGTASLPWPSTSNKPRQTGTARLRLRPRATRLTEE